METTIENPWLKWQAAFAEEGMTQMKRWSRLPLIAEKARKVTKGATPSEVVHRVDHIKLLHYPSSKPVKHKTPLLVVFALVNRPYILDLKEGRSVIRHFVDAGFDTYLIDWGSPTLADRYLGLDDYINRYMDGLVDFVCERAGSSKASILGYCMGGTMSTIYTALHRERVANLMLMAAGIDFSTREGLLNLWADPNYFDVDEFVDTFGNCPAEFLQSSFLMLKPVGNLIEKPLNFMENVHNDKFVEDFLTMETWLNDNISVPGEIFREFVKSLYQKNQLVKDELHVRNHRVRLKDVTCPLLNIVAKGDDLVPCSQSLALNDLVGSNDRKTMLVPAGHIGLAVGGKAQRETWPAVCEWLAERSNFK
jgi:polyhydroxyalkanoate synthase